MAGCLFISFQLQVHSNRHFRSLNFVIASESGNGGCCQRNRDWGWEGAVNVILTLEQLLCWYNEGTFKVCKYYFNDFMGLSEIVGF